MKPRMRCVRRAILVAISSGALVVAAAGVLRPVPGFAATDPCSPLFTVDETNDFDTYTAGEGVITGPLPAQLDILSGDMKLTSDGQTLLVLFTLADLGTSTIPLPTGSGEDDYRFVWTNSAHPGLNGSTTYFALAAVEPDGSVIYSDGQAITVATTTRFEPLNVDTGSFGTGPNGVVEIDVPLTNINAPSGTLLTSTTGETDIRNGTALTGLLTIEDGPEPGSDFLVGQTCATTAVPEAPVTSALVIGGAVAVALAALLPRHRRRVTSR